jgi:hypothetical protein
MFLRRNRVREKARPRPAPWTRAASVTTITPAAAHRTFSELMIVSMNYIDKFFGTGERFPAQ